MLHTDSLGRSLSIGLKALFAATAMALCLSATSAENRVLQLDGDGDYVELPSDIFNDFEEATVEGWIKWERFGTYMRFFDFGKAWQAMVVGNFFNTPDLNFELWLPGRQQHTIVAANILRTNEWCHIALVTGKQGVKLYFDGMLVGTNAFTGSFSAIKNGEHNYLGRNNWKEQSRMSDDFHGQIDEVRVWRVARTAEEIRENLFQRLAGKEAGLAGLWNFDDGTARDAAAGHDGKLIGDAKCVEAKLPASSELVRPAVLYGKVTDPDGKLLARANVRLQQKDSPPANATTDATGIYWLAAYSTNEVFDLLASQGSLNEKRSGLQVHAGESRKLDLILQPTISLTGTVLAPDNKSPLSSVVVQVVNVAPTNEAARGKVLTQSEVVATVGTDARGEFKFIDLKAGQYQVRCQVPGQFVYAADGKTYQVERDKPALKVDFRIAPFKTGTWKKFSNHDKPAHNQVNQIEADAAGLLWFATLDGVWSFDGNEFLDRTKEADILSGPVNAMLPGADGTMWFGMSSSVVRYDGGKFVRFTTADGLADNRVNALLPDRDGAAWFATDFGISQYDGKKFTSLARSNGVPDKFVYAIHRSADGAIWFGTYGAGVTRFDGKISVNFTKAEGLADDRVRKIFGGPDGVVWFGTWGGGVSRYDGTNFTTLSQKDGLAHNSVNAFHRDEGGVMWFGTEGGVSRYDGKTFVNFTTADGLAHNRVRAIDRDANGTLWFGTDGGLSRYDERTTGKAVVAPQSARANTEAKAKPKTASPPKPSENATSRASTRPLELKPTWKAGARYVYRVDITQTVQFRFPGMPRAMKQEFEMGQVYALSPGKERDGGGRELEMKFLEHELSAREGNNVFVDFDSKMGDAPTREPNPLAVPLRNLTGARMMCLLSADYKLEKIADYTGFVEKLSAGAPDEGRQIFSQVYSEDLFQQIADGGRRFLPEARSIGESWSSRPELTMWLSGIIAVEAGHTFKGWEQRDERKCLAYQFAGPITTTSLRSPILPSMDLDDGKVAAKIWFDPELGAIVESQIDEVLFTRMDSSGQASPGQVQQRITIKLVDLRKADE